MSQVPTVETGSRQRAATPGLARWPAQTLRAPTCLLPGQGGRLGAVVLFWKLE